MSPSGTDRMEKKVLLRAPRARVWRALMDARQFGRWFGVELTGTMLTVVESGFDRIPPARRAEAYRMNDQGWAAQMKSVERHVGEAS